MDSINGDQLLPILKYMANKCSVDLYTDRALTYRKLQPLLYYINAFYYALKFDEKYHVPLFYTPFEAWSSGPCLSNLYRSFYEFEKNEFIKNYSKLHFSKEVDIDKFEFDGDIPFFLKDSVKAQDLIPSLKCLVDDVLQHYGCFTGEQLEFLVQQEKPWIETRNGLLSIATCTRIIPIDLIKYTYLKVAE